MYCLNEQLTEEVGQRQLQWYMQEESQSTSYSQADQGQKMLPLSLHKSENELSIVNSTHE